MNTGAAPGRGPDGAGAAQGFRVTVCVAAVLMVASLIQFLPARTMPRAMVSEGSAMSVLWPQGWNFYSSEPTRPAVVAYRVDDGGGLTAITIRQMSVRTDLGLNRAGSAQLVELGNVSAGLPRTAWQGCAGLDPGVCERRTLSQARTGYRDSTSHPTLCGHTLIAVVDPGRWGVGAGSGSGSGSGRWPNEWEIEECANVYVDCV